MLDSSVQPSLIGIQEPSSVFAISKKLKASSSVHPIIKYTQEPSLTLAYSLYSK